MKGTISISVFCVILALWPGFGCMENPGKATIRLFTWTPAWEEELNRKLVDRFNTTHRGLRAELINHAASRAMDKLQTMMASGEPPDVISVHGAFFPAFAAKGALLDLGPFVRADGEIETNDFFPALLDSSRYGGKLYSLPRYLSVYVLFYNKDMFDAEGIPYPSADWTWDEYLEAAKQITRDLDDDGRTDRWGCAIDLWGARVYPWVWQNGGAIFTPDQKVCLLDRPSAREAVRFVADLQFRHKVTPRVLPDEYRNNMEFFRTGRVAMIIGGAWDIQQLRTMTFHWDIAGLPKMKRKATMMGSENYSISSATRYPAESWQLLKFLLSRESQKLMAEKLDKQPSRRSVSEGYARLAADFNRKVLVDAVEYGVVPPNPVRWPELSHFLQDRLDLVWTGKEGVEKALSDACLDINNALK